MAEIPAGVSTVQEEVKQALGDKLKSLAVYGRALRKILVLVDAVTPEILDALAKPIINARKDNLFVLVATPHDIHTSADVFPVRYLEIKKTHKPLEGEDFLSTLEIHEDHLKLRTEQELKSGMFRLRQAYVTASIAPKRAVHELGEVLRATLPAVELLKERCEAAKGLDTSALELDSPPSEDVAREVIGKIHEVVASAGGLADEWNKG